MSRLMTTKPERRPRLRPGLALLLATLALLLTIWPGAAGVHAQSDAPLPSAPDGVTAADGPQTGAVNITWRPVAGAAFYRIGWVKMADIPVARSDGRHWLDAFAFTDVANLGQTAHTLTDLRPAADYAFIVGSVNARFATAAWSEWAYLTPAGTPSCSAASSGNPTDGGATAPGNPADGAATAPPTAGSVASDRAALVALYRATGGDNWGDNTNWLSDAPLGHWHGVTTDKDGRVIELTLGQRYFPNVSAYNSSKVTYGASIFDDGTALSAISGFNLVGEIPATIGSLDRLQELHLGGNQLTGEIPVELGNLSNLSGLTLSKNTLTGRIPAELGGLSKLQSLYLNDNVLTGEIPAELGSLANLQGLWLNDNVLTGEIPTGLSNLLNIQKLRLDGNVLTGRIPAELGSLGNLQSLRLSDNVLTGGIPSELGNLANLQELYLHGNVLTGGIPAELGNLANLWELSLRDNHLTGGIPVELGNLLNLDRLYLTNNRLSGCIPAVWQIGAGRRYTNDLDRLGLPFCNASSDAAVHHQSDRATLVALYNAMDGPNWNYTHNWNSDLPIQEWSGVTVLLNGRVAGLHLDGNRLTGEIPAELGNLTSLRELSLGNNQLTGGIPAELGNLTSLRDLSLGNNQLTGRIPTELGNLANLQSLYLSDNPLTGCIPESLRKLGRGLYTPGLVFCDLTSDDLALIANDRAALVALYNTAGGPDWNNNVNWLSDAPLGQWHGVTTDHNGRVTALHLRYQLTGKIPADLGNLANLRELRIRNNRLLTGEIPAELGNLTKLQSLHLNNNQLTGEIPAELGNLTKLQSLHLNNNQLTGTIPAELDNLVNLGYLSFGGNRLTGAIPTELGNLTNLWSLNLGDNVLSGVIPVELGNIANLGSLYLHNNRLTGGIPVELGNLDNLHNLDLHRNDLTGTIPAALGNLANLYELYLRDNQLTGCVPQGLSDVHHNDFASLSLSFCDP